jgi:uncharacterized protein (TIGR03437 family)
VPFEYRQGEVALGDLTMMPPTAPSLGIFTTDGVYAAALNQDGTVNSLYNRAAAGSVVALYATGAMWPAGMQDRAVAEGAMALDQEANQFEVVDGIGTPLSILYAGAAPGIIEGVFQINVQLTPGVLTPLTLHSRGTLVSNAVNVYLQTPQRDSALP